MASTRFPGKPLHMLAGKPMVQWVYESCLGCTFAERVIIATPDAEIAEVARGFGAEVAMTRADHPSGTDRLAEVAESHDADLYVNVQGDEPLIDRFDIEACAGPLLRDASCPMASLYAEASEPDLENPAVVKVVTSLVGDALYFSRFALPFARNPRLEPVKRHIGMYAFRRDVLRSFASWPQAPLEQTESLEQLRFLEHGIRIAMSKGSGSGFGVDTPDQAIEMERLLLNRA